MNNELRQLALDIFERASTLRGDERTALVNQACSGDLEVRELVLRLLRADEQTGLLDRPPVADDAHIAAQLGRALAHRYVIERLIGRGGSAVVFLADDRAHDRRVVLKVLDPEVAEIWGAERFQREVEIASRLSHPRIVGLVESGEADGLFYYVMPFVEGETLRARIDRDGALCCDEAMPLLFDIADALAHAHEAGVVHRDLKPGNVLCADGHALLLDFGVAKLVRVGHQGSKLTAAGVIVGTPAYMAPEQRDATPHIDHRVDIYSWGLMAAEMFTGLPARELRGVLPTLGDAPPDMARLVSECLATDPAHRPADAMSLLGRIPRILT